MVDLGKNNFFVLENDIALYAILDSLELQGINFIHLKKNTTLKYGKSYEYNFLEELPQLILDNSFRLDMMVIDSYNPNEVMKYVRYFSDLPIIILSTYSSKFDKDYFDYAYKLGRDFDKNSKFNLSDYRNYQEEKSYVENLKTGTKISLKNLKLQEVRDYKLNLILKK